MKIDRYENVYDKKKIDEKTEIVMKNQIWMAMYKVMTIRR